MRKIKKYLVFVAVAVLAFNIVGCSDITQNGDKKQEENAETQKTEFGVGETAEKDGVKVTLADVIKSKGDNMFATPDDGNVYEVCIFEIVNNSDEDVSISSLMCFEAYCDDTSIDQDIMGAQAPEAEKYKTLDGDIAPGKKMKGAIVYQVPKKWNKIEINVQLDLLEDDEMKFIVEN